MDRAHEKDVLQGAAISPGVPAIADETHGLECDLKGRLDRAVAQMRLAIAQVNRDSALFKVSAQAFEDFVADEIPSEAVWEEKLDDAANDW